MESKKRILIVNDLLQGGGVEKLMYDLVWAWHDKYDITIRTDWCDEAFKELYPENVKYYSVFSPKIIHSEAFWARKKNRLEHILWKKKIEKIETNDNFDIVIAIKDGATTLSVSKMQIDRKIAWVHTDYRYNYYTGQIYGSKENELGTLKNFEKVVCVSEDVMTGLKTVVGDPGNLIVKYNPINSENILEKAREEVVDLDEKVPGVPRFVTVGRINPQKGYDLLANVCRMLEKEGYRFELIIVGGKEPWGDEYEKLQGEISRLKLKNLKLIGSRKNPYKYIKSADWFLSSSRYEGFSLVSQEAAVLDVPMILTDVSGVRELLGDSEYGIVVDPDIAGIYEGMKKVLDDPKCHEYYRQKIMERKSIITYQDRIDRIEELFD